MNTHNPTKVSEDVMNRLKTYWQRSKIECIKTLRNEIGSLKTAKQFIDSKWSSPLKEVFCTKDPGDKSMTEREKFNHLLEWLRGAKNTASATFREDYTTDDPFTVKDMILIYDDIIAIVETVRDGEVVVRK